MATHRGSLLILTAVGLLFFGNLLFHPARTLYSDTSDLIAFHLPYKHFSTESFQQTGELPRWCPYLFGGMPFVHDIGASVYYPPHFALLFLPPAWLGAAMSWLVVFHVIVAGWCMYALAVERGLHNTGALAAALVYMLGGKWLLHLLAGGHYNMIALAWLPLVLLCSERALSRCSIAYALWAGTGLGVIALCAYPYLTLYSGLLVAVWIIGFARPWNAKTVIDYGRVVGLGLVVAVAAIGIAAAQLLPGLEMASETSRATGIGLSADYFANGVRALVGMVGPPLSDEPNCWENRAGLGIVTFGLLLLAFGLREPRARFEANVLIGLVIFGLGGAALVQWLPGFRLFRLPSRMLLIAFVPAALLIGRSLQALADPAGLSAADRLEWRRRFVKVSAISIVLMAVFTASLCFQGNSVSPRWHWYWVTLAVSLPATIILIGLSTPARYRWLGAAWIAVLALDLLGMSLNLVKTRQQSDVYAPSACVRWLAEREAKHGRVLDYPPLDFSTNHTPLWSGLPVAEKIESLRGFNPLDVRRYKEFLQFLTDEDRELQTLDGMFTGPLVGSFPIRNQRLADLLGVRYLVQPADLPLEATVIDAKGRDQWTETLTDAAPTTFDIIAARPGGRDGGQQPLPPYVVYENQGCLPRAFIVPDAKPLPERTDVLAALRSTDFRQTVLLEDANSSILTSTPGGFRKAAIARHEPNAVDIHLDDPSGGHLVLADVWFPGWACHIDGRPAPIHRANYLFRAVALPPGATQVEFRFEPRSVWWGERISLITFKLVAILSVIAIAFGSRRRGHAQRQSIEAVAHA